MQPLLMVLLLVSAASADILNINNGVIVHLFEWKWEDIEKECKNFLGPRGFAGVQISPPNENRVINNRPWYERYQPVSYKLQTRSGNKEQLASMIKTCNEHGVRIFADAVLNHMTGGLARNEKAVGTAESKFSYEDYEYHGVGFKKHHFHTRKNPKEKCPEKIVNYQDPEEVRNCQLEGMRDLDHAHPEVIQKQVEYLNTLIDMGVAGFRIDAAKHIWPHELKEILKQLKDLNVHHKFKPGTRPLIWSEVIDYGGEPIRWFEYSHLGMVLDFKYCKEMGRTFQEYEDFTWIKNFELLKELSPRDKSMVFIDNHDTQREALKHDNQHLLNYKKFRPYKMAIAFMLAYGWGTPNILSGFNFEKHDDPPPNKNEEILSPVNEENENNCINGWMCEHRWRQIYNMVEFHNVVSGTEVGNLQLVDSNPKQIAFCRGDKGFIAFNKDDSQNLDAELEVCVPKGKYCDVISGELKGKTCGRGKIVVVKEVKTTTGKVVNKARIEINQYNKNDPDYENDGVLAIHVKSKILDDHVDIEEWCNNEERDVLTFCEENKGLIAFSKKHFVVGDKLDKICLPKGIYCDVVSGSIMLNACTGKMIVVDEHGNGEVKMSPFSCGHKESEMNYEMIGLHFGAKVNDQSDEPSSSWLENMISCGSSIGVNVEISEEPQTQYTDPPEHQHLRNSICEKYKTLEKVDGSSILQTVFSEKVKLFSSMKTVFIANYAKELMVYDLMSVFN